MKNNIHFPDLWVKEKLEQLEVEFQAEDWAQMEKLLEAENTPPPREKRWKNSLFWSIAVLIVAGFFYQQNKKSASMGKGQSLFELRTTPTPRRFVPTAAPSPKDKPLLEPVKKTQPLLKPVEKKDEPKHSTAPPPQIKKTSVPTPEVKKIKEPYPENETYDYRKEYFYLPKDSIIYDHLKKTKKKP